MTRPLPYKKKSHIDFKVACRSDSNLPLSVPHVVDPATADTNTKETETGVGEGGVSARLSMQSPLTQNTRLAYTGESSPPATRMSKTQKGCGAVIIIMMILFLDLCLFPTNARKLCFQQEPGGSYADGTGDSAGSSGMLRAYNGVKATSIHLMEAKAT